MESIQKLQWYMLYYLDNFKNFTCFTPFSMIGQQYPKSRKIWHLGKIIPWLVTWFWFSMMVAPLKTFQYFCHVPMFWLCHSRQSYPSSLCLAVYLSRKSSDTQSFQETMTLSQNEDSYYLDIKSLLTSFHSMEWFMCYSVDYLVYLQ